MTTPRVVVRTCRAGHQQTRTWQEANGCWRCDQADRERALSDPGEVARFRAEKLAELGPMPDELRVGDVVHRIPRGLRRRR